MNTVLIILIVVQLLFICISDIQKRQIPNRHLIICFGLMVVLCLSNKWYWSFPWIVLVLAFGFFIWLIGGWGAGDAKLLAILSLLVKPEFYFYTLCLILMSGGVFALASSLVRKFSLKNGFNTVAYGVPIVIGCMCGFVLSIAEV